MRFVLPWPPMELSPNSRMHWAALAKAKKAYRQACAWQAKAQGAQKIEAESLSVTVEFHQPDKRRRDYDNMVASIKSGLDGVADAIGVPDDRWRVRFDFPATIGGMVVVTVAA